MPTRDGDQGSRFVSYLLGSLQSALRRRAAVVAAMWATAGALAATAGLLAVDWATAAPDSSRPVVYVAAGAAAVAIVAGAAFRAWRRKPSPLYVARLIEAQRPDLKNALLTFAEFVRDPSADPSMTAAVGRRAATILARDVPAQFLPPPGIRRPLAAVLGAGAIVGLMLWLAQGTRVRPWIASAEGGLMGADIVPVHPGPDVPRPVPLDRPGASPSGGHERSAKKTAGRNPADANEAAKAPAPRPSRTQRGGEAAAAQALAAAIRADAKTFERLAGALAAGGASDVRGDGAGTGTPQHDGHAVRGGPGDPPRNHDDSGTDAVKGAVSRRPSPARAADGAEPPPGAGGAAAPQGVRPHAAGGAVGTKPPRKTVGDSPLPDREPSNEFPKNALDAMRRARRLIKEADRRLREGEVTDAFLDRMGVGNAEFRRFVVAWQRKFEAVPAGPAVTPPPREVRSATGKIEGDVLRPDAGSEAAPIVGPVDLGPDGRKGSVQGAASWVSPRLRPAVTAYFRAVDRLTAEPSEKDPAK